MSESEEVEFRRLLYSVGNKLSDFQTKGIAEIYGIPSRLFNNGADLLAVLNTQGKIKPEIVDKLREVLEDNHAATEVVELVDTYISRKSTAASSSARVGSSEIQTSTPNNVAQSTTATTHQYRERPNSAFDTLKSTLKRILYFLLILLLVLLPILPKYTPAFSVLSMVGFGGNDFDSGSPPELFYFDSCVQTFVDRKAMAERLSVVAEPPAGNDSATQYFALIGKGGTGKTQMALWFCEHMKGKGLYSVIWSMSGDGLERFTEDLEDLMDELGIEYRGVDPMKLRRLLSKELDKRGKWLLVVDNFEEMVLNDLKERIPELGGIVLLTTRDSNLALPVENIVIMLPFSEDETSKLFERILGKGLVSQSDLKTIRDIFGNNTLALSVCAYYLREMHVTAGERPLNIINESLKQIIEESAGKETEETITAMYERTLSVIAEKMPESWRMMEKLSLLSAGGVSREVVRKMLKGKVVEEELEKKVKEIEDLVSSGKLEGAETLSTGISSASGTLPLLPSDSCEEYLKKESELMGEILRLGLAEKRGDKYYVHRLMMQMMQMIQERMRKSTGEFTSVTSVTSVLEEVIGDMYRMWIWDSRDHTQWKKKQEMGEHVVSLAIREEYLTSAKNRDQLVRMLYDYTLYTMGVKRDYTTAEERIAKAEQVEGGGKCSKGVRAILKNVRGDLRRSQGKYTEAITEYRKALEMEEEESRKAVYHNSIGICLRNLKKYPEALEEYEKSLEIDMKYNGEDSLEVSDALDNMAFCLSDMGKYKEALEKHRRVLEIRLGKYGQFNRLVASSYNNIGICYSLMEKYQQALKMHEKALEIYNTVYGKEYHPDVAMSLNNLGQSLMRLGRYNEAKLFLEDAIWVGKKVMGEDHPDTVTYTRNFNRCLSNLT